MSTGRRTIAVIGAGNVGATCAFSLAERKLGNIVMLDIFEGFAKGKALDMSQAAQILNYDGVVKGTSSYEDIEGAEVVVVTSGFPRKPGMTREDLISKNASIISEVGAGIKKYAPDSVVIVVHKPIRLDDISHVEGYWVPTSSCRGAGGYIGFRKDDAFCR